MIARSNSVRWMHRCVRMSQIRASKPRHLRAFSKASLLRRKKRHRAFSSAGAPPRRQKRPFHTERKVRGATRPEATMSGSKGWNLTVQGVRGCPTSVATISPDAKSITFTVWSPCVDAKRLRSGENLRASVCERHASSSSSRTTESARWFFLPELSPFFFLEKKNKKKKNSREKRETRFSNRRARLFVRRRFSLPFQHTRVASSRALRGAAAAGAGRRARRRWSIWSTGEARGIRPSNDTPTAARAVRR